MSETLPVVWFLLHLCRSRADLSAAQTSVAASSSWCCVAFSAIRPSGPPPGGWGRLACTGLATPRPSPCSSTWLQTSKSHTYEMFLYKDIGQICYSFSLLPRVFSASKHGKLDFISLFCNLYTHLLCSSSDMTTYNRLPQAASSPVWTRIGTADINTVTTEQTQQRREEMYTQPFHTASSDGNAPLQFQRSLEEIVLLYTPAEQQIIGPHGTGWLILSKRVKPELRPGRV